MRSDPKTATDKKQIETGQNSSEASKCTDSIRLDESIKEAHSGCLDALRSLESQLSKRLDEITENMQSYEFAVSEKQDMIESLELTCKNKDVTIDEMQNELNMNMNSKGKKSHRRKKSFPLWKSKGSYSDEEVDAIYVSEEDISGSSEV
uniref:Uncharacterized protein n=1 Tax=Eucampia antarctica TaxID=49252 RepID=A0A7S2W3G0_9STRA